jgi:hypothetical protein
MRSHQIYLTYILGSTHEQTYTTQLQQFSQLLTSNCGLLRLKHLDFKNNVHSSTKTRKHQMSFNNTLKTFYLSFHMLYANNGLHHFPMNSLLWFFPKQLTTMFLLLFQQSHKIGWTPNIEGDKFWNDKSLARDVQNKELPNVIERSIHIKITIPTHVWSMIIVHLWNFNKTLKIIDLKTAPTSNKKPLLFLKIRSTIQNHL